MIKVTIDELVSEKILPFDLYNEIGEKIFSAGEVLTPGKLLQLRYISVIYREVFEDEEYEEEEELEDEVIEDEVEDSSIVKEEKFAVKEEKLKSGKTEIAVKKEEKPSKEFKYLTDLRVNTISNVPKEIQLEIKEFCQRALDGFGEESLETNAAFFVEAKERIIKDVLPQIELLPYKSQMKLIGDYDSVHSANVAILATLLASKIGLSDSAIEEVALSALFHDIGKTRIPKEILSKKTPSVSDLKLIKMHPQIGYKILKREMNLPESICKVALEHHEHNDGSGFPYGVSGDLISMYSQIISVCNFYDNLTSNKGTVQVKSAKDATKLMLSMGGKYFMPNVLYTFVHMSNFNDLTPIDSLI